MDVLRSSRLKIEGLAADIFLKRLWPRWELFTDMQGDDGRALIEIIARQYASHIADHLGLDKPENVTWHPFENYVHPALIADRAHTGDIFLMNEELWVVLTPQCDMATGKVPNILLAKCARGTEKWADNIKMLREAESNSKKKDAQSFFRDHVNQNVGSAKHFLPPLPGESEPLIVQFSNIMTIGIKDLNDKLDARVATIASPFLPNIVQRFGAHISRTGQPNIDVNRFID